MLSLPPSVRIFVATEPVDLRKGFDGLSAAAREVLRQDPLSGHLFVFINRRRNRAKILVWDRSGFWLLYKRLERGRFRLPRPRREGASAIEMEATDLALLLEGIELGRTVWRPRWEPAEQTS